MGWYCQVSVFEERFPSRATGNLTLGLANVTDAMSIKHESKGNKRIFTVLKTKLTSEFLCFFFSDMYSSFF